MNTKSIIWATIAGSVVMTVIAGIAHEIVFASFFRQATESEHQGTAIIFVSYLLLSFIMTYFYSILPKTDKPIVDGSKYGAIFGILWVFPHGLAMAAAHGESISYELINGVWHVIEQGIGGMSIALVFSKFSASASTE